MEIADGAINNPVSVHPQVLLINNCAASSASIRSMLHFCTVTAVPTANEAEVFIAHNNVDIIITTYTTLSTDDCINFMTRLRENPATQRLSLLIVPKAPATIGEGDSSSILRIIEAEVATFVPLHLCARAVRKNLGIAMD